VGDYFPEDSAGNSWDWSLVPSLSSRVSEAPVSIGIGRTIAVNASTKHADGVAAYINWLIDNPKAQLAKTAAVGVAPMPLRFEAGDFPSDMDSRVARLYQTIADAKTIGYLTWTFWPPKSNRYLYEQMDKVIVGDLSVSDYLSGLDTVFAEELSAGLVPPRPKPYN
jgi:raffinose/stachyose/melibiose transport system substrate-binding protein